ncbi:RNA 2'-phosphotransferase [Paraburkholderia ginsengisoli]|uniref:Probable RNA 2'-phosphotransferase n=1 Tax=Paraburkholderia ginsengisoli TaxID=311231 RepID=A0A7T4T7U4_9BURK|nr:RNA 2'-phosphotransferase [Paraburkholderia ginsengisoli]QQC63182.1 RNA 2'-phosphotransferase [Paraburkholderia ginsengisoli]
MNTNADSRVAAGHAAVSRLLSKILRHEPEMVGIRLDRQGWVSVDELIRAIERTARNANASKRLRTLPTVTRELILAVVATNEKQRFSLSQDGLRIRAAQGHSIGVDLGYADMEPPAVLYHGTAWSNWESIAADGLTPRTRHAVHLSTDVNTATRVGARHGQPLVLVVDAAQMHADGYSFARSDNGVWLTPAVPTAYLSKWTSDERGPSS